MAIKAINDKYRITYTGTYTDETITSNGKRCRLLTLTGSGMLTVSGDVTARLCLAGGGSPGGITATDDGGAGGHVRHYNNVVLTSGLVTVGAAQEASSYGAMVAEGATGKNGGTGAGTREYMGEPGTGDGVTTLPFNDSVNFQPLSGAGGGATYTNNMGGKWAGCDGGSNGGNGANSAAVTGVAVPGNGGVRGGGRGGDSTPSGCNGQDADYYGGGGGGAGAYYSSGTQRGTPGAGYQGVVMILIEEE